MAERRLEVVRRERNLYEQQRDRARAEHQALRDAVQEEIERLRQIARINPDRRGMPAVIPSHAADRLANLLNESGGER
jgi:hypothetical protein